LLDYEKIVLAEFIYPDKFRMPLHSNKMKELLGVKELKL
jgi:hypothetical protein